MIGYRTKFFENCFQKVVDKTDEFLGNKITDAVTKSNNGKNMKPDDNSGNLEEIVIPLEKRAEILNELRKAL